MTDERPASTDDDRTTNDTEPVQRPEPDHAMPVSDGPGQHHANARTDHSPAPQHRAQRY